MRTPIADYVSAYAERSPVRAHMPGHKGNGALERLDITEVDGAGVLYTESSAACHSEPQGEESMNREGKGILRCAQNDMTDIIMESERNAAALFGAAKTLYSAEGSSLCIRAMLYLARLHAVQQGRRPVILAGRNAHAAFLSGAALLDLPVEWLLPEGGSVLSCEIESQALDACIRALPEPPAAVYITSPDYLGNTADLPALARVCHAHGCLLLVDNAHGAYLRFLPQSRHPMDLGADLCCDSAHKTLPVLTGGAYLHFGRCCPVGLLDAGESAMRLFASTSPSYLILQSLDRANAVLAKDYPQRLEDFCKKMGALMDRLSRLGYSLSGDEPLKLTIDAKAYGYLGTALAACLMQRGISCEFADPDFLVLMLSPENSDEDLKRIEAALCSIPKRRPIEGRPPVLSAPQTVISPRQALLSPSVRLPAAECEGRILAQPSVSCPPAVPIAVCGERLNQTHLSLFAYYGIGQLRVVRPEFDPQLNKRR